MNPLVKRSRTHSSVHSPSSHDTEKKHTLADALSASVLQKLKQTKEELEAEEARKKEELRKQEEERQRLEKKRLENDFQYLLENSNLDWRKFK
ncbi:YqkE family protein [Collibacillus ludicampi]|uniref:YqkE family protein n=1 Tax=Collibacillus ludicampi TaxID=2771369 RepID=UPI003F6FC5B6